MNKIDYEALVLQIKGTEVERPNKASLGTLSGHATGEPFEKSVYGRLKTLYGNKIYKQYEYLNDLYLRNPKVLTVEARNALFSSPTVLFLLSRGETATRRWNPSNVFEEKQNDTADIIYYDDGFYDLIDIKTRNIAKSAQAPNIISAYKVAQMCAFMIDNEDYDVFRIHYIEVDWVEEREKGLLLCRNAHYGALFKACPDTLYIIGRRRCKFSSMFQILTKVGRVRCTIGQWNTCVALSRVQKNDVPRWKKNILSLL